MNRRVRDLFVALLIALLPAAGSAVLAADAEGKPEAKPEAAVASEDSKGQDAAKAERPTLTPAQTALRDQVRRALAMHKNQAYSTQSNVPTEIMAYSLGFGCATEVWLDGQKRINGITSLCWGYPCAGYEMLGMSQGRIAPRIGYGYQQRPGEFLAMLAMSRVPASYAVRVGSDARTVANVVEAEKLACRAGVDQSLALIGLSFYIDEPEWKNDLGETWSISQIVQEELAQPVVSAPEGGLNRLMGLSYAVARRAKRGQPIDGQFQRAKKYVADFQQFAMQMQNSDGSWGPNGLSAKSASNDPAVQLRASGRILEWLAMSMPDEKLADAKMAGAVDYVSRLLSTSRYQRSTPSLATREIVSVGHALHALNVYDDRAFKPADVVEEKPAAEEQTPKAANRETSSAR